MVTTHVQQLVGSLAFTAGSCSWIASKLRASKSFSSFTHSPKRISTTDGSESFARTRAHRSCDKPSIIPTNQASNLHKVRLILTLQCSNKKSRCCRSVELGCNSNISLLILLNSGQVFQPI